MWTFRRHNPQDENEKMTLTTTTTTATETKSSTSSLEEETSIKSEESQEDNQIENDNLSSSAKQKQELSLTDSNDSNNSQRSHGMDDQLKDASQVQKATTVDINNNNNNNSDDFDFISSSSSNRNAADEETIYDFYKEKLFPAIMSSFPILLHKIWKDIVNWITIAAHELYLFILPTWIKENHYNQQSFLAADAEYNGTSPLSSSSTPTTTPLPSYYWFFMNSTQQLWEQAINSSKNVNATIAEFMIQHFDTNKDGHISANELLNMTDLMMKLPIQPSQYYDQINNRNYTPMSFWTWFSREWPLMDWKIGVFLWQTFGGILLVIAVLSIVPGRLHSWSGKILRWPVLGLTYLLIGVELIVYIVIRIGIRIAETIFATPKHRKLRRQMATSKSYEEWYQYAAALDLSQKRDKWQRTINDSTSYQYNWRLIQQLITDMKEARTKQDVILALAVLQQCTRKNVGGIMSEDLFTKTYTGEPKFIVIEFIGEVTKTLHWVTEEVLAAEASLDNDSNDMVGDDDNGNDNANQERTKHNKKIDRSNSRDLERCEQSLEFKSKNEREHLWQSLIGLAINVATLNFNPDDDKKDRKKEREKKKEDGSKLKRELSKEESAARSAKIKSAAAAMPIGSPVLDTPALDDTDVLKNLSFGASAHDLLSTATSGTDAASDGGPSIKSLTSVPTMARRKQLLAFLKRARAAYGRTALCLSGGAMMGLYHIGHMQGLMETDCLPNIVSGCSAGSVVGAILCTRTNDELQRDLDPQVIGPHMKCFERSWPDRIVSLWKTGNLFSSADWHRMIKWFTCGDMTFEEAYHKTGRIFCIALAATTKKTPPVLINYISAPNVTIASAVVASAAVPGFVSPQQLQVKDADGTVRSAGPETYFDGSIRHDIPTAGLSEMLNCQFFVACQCNPHIVPFFFDPKGGVGRPSRWYSGDQETSWRGGFLLAALEMYLKNDMKAKHVFLRDLDAAVSFTGTMLTQSFEGSTTIVPRVQLRDFFVLFSDPSVDSLYRYNQVGSVAAYQHAAMIRLHYRIADALDECIDKLEFGHHDEGQVNDSFKIKVSRRASFDVTRKIVSAIAKFQTPRESQHMPEVIQAALQERLESDSTSLSDGSTG